MLPLSASNVVALEGPGEPRGALDDLFVLFCAHSWKTCPTRLGSVGWGTGTKEGQAESQQINTLAVGAGDEGSGRKKCFFCLFVVFFLRVLISQKKYKEGI